MSGPAHVASIDDLKAFVEQFAKFIDGSRGALDAVDTELRRTLDWLSRDQMGFWKSQLQQRQEVMAQFKGELFRKRVTQFDPGSADLTEQKANLKKAQLKVEEAEAKIKLIHRWSVQLQRAVDDYQSRARQLAQLLEGKPPPSLQMLRGMVEALDAYTALSPVSGLGLDSPGTISRTSQDEQVGEKAAEPMPVDERLGTPDGSQEVEER